MIIRHAALDDLKQIADLEAVCFPVEEAADTEILKKRLENYSECFWLLEEDGKLISMINGIAADIPMLVDEMYSNVAMHSENGAWFMIFGVDTHPDYRRMGHAEQLMKHVIADAVKMGRKGIVLTCKEALIPYYKKFGFVNEGKSNSKHGGAVWYDMRLMITDEYSVGEE